MKFFLYNLAKKKNIIIFHTTLLLQHTNILASVPSSSSSNETTALSVSISQRTSPGSILSPSFLNHWTIFPSVIVGDREGMFTGNPSAASNYFLDKKK